MDKENLYYVVEKGTNVREYYLGGVWIGEKEEAMDKLIRINAVFKNPVVIMSIREYEEKFTDIESTTFTYDVLKRVKELLNTPLERRKVSPSYQLYSTGKHLLGEYNNKVIVIHPEELSIGKVITDLKTVLDIRGCIQSALKGKTQEWDNTIEHLIESAT